MKRILIADDSEINRDILATIFEDQFAIDQAENGEIAIELIEKASEQYSLIMLDLLMPIKSGLDVLDFMNEKKMLETVPVIMITGESTPDTELKFYEYGVADTIYKPFSRKVVMRRALNIIELYEQRADMERKLSERTYALEEAVKKLNENNDFLVNALSSILELRSVESGLHIHRVQELTHILLVTWREMNPECTYTDSEIALMVQASALHDIGKIAIPDEILCKPGKLTKEEFEIMKTHTTKGCELLERFKQEESSFYRYCYDICRYHHEKYDGHGYPDSIVGRDIPVWAQIVSVADVFDALVSPRVYKAPYDVEEACRMIHAGECGIFNPKILECFDRAKEHIIRIAETATQ